MAKRDVLTFDNFQGGERGIIDDWRSLPGTFRAKNMLVLRTGEICVRPGLKNITPSGVGNGKVWLFAATDNNAMDRWYIQGNQVKGFRAAGTNHQTLSGTLTGTPTEAVAYVSAGGVLYFTVRGNSTYKLTPDTVSTFTRLTASPGGGRAIALYNDLLMIGNLTEPSHNRMYWSDVADPTTWPADNFMDIDSFNGIGGMYLQNNHLAILKQDSIWVLYGQPGYNETVRKVLKINSALSQMGGAAAFLDEIYFQGLGAQWPSKFNGSSAAILHNLEYGSGINGTNGVNDMVAIPLRNRDEGVVILAGAEKKAVVNINDIWTFHEFGVSTLANLGNNDGGVDNIVLLTDGGDTAANPKFYSWDVTAQHPGFNDGGYSSPGDDSLAGVEGTLTMPMQARRDGAEFKVRSVRVNFRKWNNGASNNNYIEMKVRRNRPWDGVPVDSAVVTVLDEAPSASDTTGTQDSILVNIPDNVEANAFQVIFPKLRGVAIQSFQVILEGIDGAKH